MIWRIQNLKFAHLVLNLNVLLTKFLTFWIQEIDSQRGLKHQLVNSTMQENAAESICTYLLKLKDTSKQLLYFYQRKTTILGFVYRAKSITTTAKKIEMKSI